jgi:hypothetical protein
MTQTMLLPFTESGGAEGEIEKGTDCVQARQVLLDAPFLLYQEGQALWTDHTQEPLPMSRQNYGFVFGKEKSWLTLI